MASSSTTSIPSYGHLAVTIYADGTFYTGNKLQFRDDSSGVVPSIWDWWVGFSGYGGTLFSHLQNASIMDGISDYLELLIPGLIPGEGLNTDKVYLPVKMITNVGSKQHYIEITTLVNTLYTTNFYAAGMNSWSNPIFTQGSSISLTNYSTGGIPTSTQWEWTIDGNLYSTSQNTSVIFYDQLIHTISYRVYNAAGWSIPIEKDLQCVASGGGGPPE